MTDAIKGAGQVLSLKLNEIGFKKEAEKLVEKETVQTEDGAVEAHVFDSEEDALKYASKDSGDEAVVKLADGRFAVVDLKSKYAEVSKLGEDLTQKDQFGQLKVRAEALFEPDAQALFPDRVLSRTRVYEGPEGNRETGMDRLEVLAPADPVKTAEHSLKLAKMAIQGEIGGFNSALASNTVKGEMYAANLSTVAQQLLNSIDGLKNQPDKSAQLQELKTALTIIQARLLILPQSEKTVPGMDLKIGAYRNPRDNDKAETLVRQRLGELQNLYGQESDEGRKSALKSQIDQLSGAAGRMEQSSLQIRQADLSIKVRLGALASMNTSLTDAQAGLKKDLAALNTLYTELHLDPKAALDVGQADARITALMGKVNDERQALIKAMEAELKVFKDHAPKIKGKLQSGAAETVALLEKQIQKLKDLKPLEGKTYDLMTCQQVLQTVNETQSQFTSQLEQASLDKIDKAAKIWEGISPDEAKQVHDIVENTGKYTQGYAEARQALDEVQDKQEIAHKVLEFEQGLYSLDENPAMTDALVDVAARTNDAPLKAQMLAALSSSPVPNSSIEAFSAKYQEIITQTLKGAKEGTKLYELQQCYTAMALAQNPDWKDRVDVEKLKTKISALAQEPEVMQAFDAAQAAAIQASIGDRAAMAAKEENYILSDDFQRRLKLSSPDEQKALIQDELHKLTLLAPDRVMDVSKKLMLKNVEAHGADMYADLTPKEGAAAFESFVKSSKKFSKFANSVGQFSKIMDKALREVAMSNGEKTPDAVVRVLQRLKASNPSAAQAIDFITEWKNSGKLGSLDGLFAGVALIAKGVPTDMVSAIDSSTSLFSLMSKGEDFAKLLGVTDDALKTGKLATLGKGLHFMKWLGPAADFIGAGLDIYKMTDEIKHGDTWGAVGKGTSAAGGIAAGVGGVMILAGCTGPAAPIVLVGGIVVGLVGWAIDAGAGESPEETLLREVGVLKPKPVEPPTQYEKRQMSPYYMHPGKI